MRSLGYTAHRPCCLLYTSVLLSGEYQARDVRQLEKMRGLPPKELVIVGIPYMDEMVRRLKENSETPPHERTVLLAPSWGDSAIFSRYGGKIIDVLLQTGYHIVVRPHPQSFTSVSYTHLDVYKRQGSARTESSSALLTLRRRSLILKYRMIFPRKCARCV